MGRKNKYETNVKPKLDKIKEWITIYTELQIAKKLGVSHASFDNYKNRYPELRQALSSGREVLIEELKDALKRKAKGFTYIETKKTIRKVGDTETQLIEQFERYSPPDTGAIHLLLKNLDDTWRNDDKQTMLLRQEELDLKKQQQQPEDDGAILQTLESIKNGT